MTHRDKGSSHKHNELRKIIAKRLREGQPFVLGCTINNISYWQNILPLHFPDAKIVRCEEGLRIS